MSETLAERFIAEGTDTITHRGRIVKAIVKIPVRDGATLVVTRRRASPDRPQALKVAVNRGQLVVNDVRSSAVALWSTTSPDVVEIGVEGADATAVDVWNAWSMGGVDSAWIGNAGIVTRSTSDGMVLMCSDGIGAPDFADLEVEILVR